MCGVYDVRARLIETNEITPQSNYVTIYSDGWCYWEPRFEMSVTHCNVELTWFPFDVQRCELIFCTLRLTGIFALKFSVEDRHENFTTSYLQTEEWYLTCACVQLTRSLLT